MSNSYGCVGLNLKTRVVMARRTDSGNLLMLILAAAVAGVFLGDWAFKFGIWIGAGVMVLGALAYVLDAWGIGAVSRHPTPASASGATVSPTRALPNPLPQLLEAVAAMDNRSIESLVLKANASPFQNAHWKGRETSAMVLAQGMNYQAAVDFFQDWSNAPSTARIRQ